MSHLGYLVLSLDIYLTEEATENKQLSGALKSHTLYVTLYCYPCFPLLYASCGFSELISNEYVAIQ